MWEKSSQLSVLQHVKQVNISLSFFSKYVHDFNFVCFAYFCSTQADIVSQLRASSTEHKFTPSTYCLNKKKNGFQKAKVKDNL